MKLKNFQIIISFYDQKKSIEKYIKKKHYNYIIIISQFPPSFFLKMEQLNYIFKLIQKMVNN